MDDVKALEIARKIFGNNARVSQEVTRSYGGKDDEGREIHLIVRECRVGYTVGVQDAWQVAGLGHTWQEALDEATRSTSRRVPRKPEPERPRVVQLLPEDMRLRK
jgi:hypothetical protein